MDNQRLILLLVFSFSVIMLWEAWQKQGQPVPAPSAIATQGAATSAINSVPTPSTVNAAPSPATAVLPLAATDQAATQTAAKQVIKTDLFVAEISAQGGDLTRLELVNHHATEDKTKSFVLFDNGEKHFYQAQTGLIGENLPNHKSLYQFISGNTELKDGQDALEVRLETVAANGPKLIKTYIFHRDSYLIDVSHEIINQGATPLVPQIYFQT